MAEAVGGYFDEFSQLMLKILVEAGLKPEHYLIDVGCGSGRLTKSAGHYLTGRYLGTDVVPLCSITREIRQTRLAIRRKSLPLRFPKKIVSPTWCAFFRS